MPHSAALPLTVSKPELLTGSSDSEFRQLVHDTLAFAARIQAIRNHMGAAIGLTGTQYTVLIAVAHNQARPGGLGVNQIAEHLQLSGAFVTIEVNKLVDAKLVAKRTNPEDRRRVLLSITAKSRSLLERLTTLQRPVHDALFDCLSTADFHRLRGLMAKLVLTGDQSLHLARFLLQDQRMAGG